MTPDLRHTVPDTPALNPAQKEAVTAPVGPLLILAGPGTGKTRVLTERVRHLVEVLCVPPQHILALTFTNKAAGEMVARLRRSPGETRAAEITAGTFHRFCMGILREYCETAGLPPHFSVADADLQRTLLYRAVPGLNLEETNLTNALHNLSRLKRQCRYDPDRSLSPGDRRLLQAYEAELRSNHLVDFDDLITIARDLLRDHDDILQACRDRFRHILVDEFQDTDRDQYEIVRMLARSHRSLFVVADDEQSIYGWRNADPENIQRFREEFIGCADPIVLEENYRSSEAIVRLARALIANNEIFHERDLHARKQGALVRAVAFDTFRDEGRFIVADIARRLDETPGLAYPQIAVLYPQHALGAELEKIFMDAGIPCQMAQTRGLFDQPTLHRALSVLRYALDGGDDASLEHFLRRELDVADPALYPAVRALQKRDNLDSFKQAAFQYPKEASEGESLEVERALGLAGVVANAAQKQAGVSLPDLVDDILDQLNTSALPSLKNHLDSIEDPFELPGFADAVDSLLPLYRNGGRIFVACRDEILRHILTQTLQGALPRPGLTVAPPGSRLALQPDALVLFFDPEPPAPSGRFVHVGDILRQAEIGPPLAALKLCQALTCADLCDYLPDYTAFDIETTDLDVDGAEIVEIGAVRVRGGREVDRFHTLVRPGGPITPGAQQTHGISAAEVAGAPRFGEIYPKFRAFFGADVLIAHNGYAFDFQVLNRQVRRSGCPRLPNPTLDTLPMARSYSPQVRHNIDALCERYGIKMDGHRHRALDDARYLHRAFEGLKQERTSRYRRMAHERLLDRVALGMLFQEAYTRENRFAPEDNVHFKLGAQRLLGPANTLIRELARRFPRLDADRLRAQTRMWLQDAPRPEALAAHAPDGVQRFRDQAAASSVGASSLRGAIRNFLDFADLYHPGDDAPSRDAVNLLTLHAAKGLEFREVYICGLEDRILPNVRALKSGGQKELEEQRRLLYVGITRAMDRLTLTCVRHRPGRDMLPSRFWDELQLKLETK